MKHINALSLAALSLAGLAATLPASAQTTGTFTDNFNAGSNTTDVNANIGAPRQGGTVITANPGGINYNEPSDTSTGDYYYDTQLDNSGAPDGGAPALLLGTINRTFATNAYISPNETLAPAVGGTLTVSYGVVPSSNDFAGSYLGPQGTFQSSPGGIGFLLTNSGTVEVFENGVQQTLATNTVTGFTNSDYNTVQETYTNNGAGNVFSLVVDNQPIFTDTNAFALTDYHASLDAYSSTGNGGVSYFNNLSISSTAPVAAPEPSQVWILGMGILGLSGMAFTARRRTLKGI